MRGLGREVGGEFGEGRVGLDGGFVDLERKHILSAALTTFSTFVTLPLCITIPTSSFPHPIWTGPHPRISFPLPKKFLCFILYFTSLFDLLIFSVRVVIHSSIHTGGIYG